MKHRIEWEVFAFCNAGMLTDAFEKMCYKLFVYHYLDNKQVPHRNHNNVGVEVEPILEPPRQDGEPQKLISFQSKYTGSVKSAYDKFKESAKKTAKNYKGKLDLVYLFSNHTLSTYTKPYKVIEKIHEEAGIMVHPVSNDDLLYLVSRYQEVVNEFFDFNGFEKERYQYPIDSTVNGILVEPDTGNIIITSKAFHVTQPSNKLLSELIKSKVSECRRYACTMEMDSLGGELDNDFLDKLDDIDEAKELYFFKILLDLYNGKDCLSYIDKCSNREEAHWIVMFCRKPYKINAEKFLSLGDATKIFVVYKLFVSQMWSNLVELYSDTYERVELSIKKQFKLYYGLSLFNLQDNNEASSVLHNLYDSEKEERFLFYAICSDIKICNAAFQNGYNNKGKELSSLLVKIEDFKELKQHKQQENMVAVITMEAYYHLGLRYDDAYIEKAINTYKIYPDKIKENKYVRLYYAVCSELRGNREEALKAYSMLEWESEPTFAERYMLCCILGGEAEKAIEIYRQVRDKSIRLDSVYLFALYKSESCEYIENLRSVMERNRDDIASVVDIAYFIDTPSAYKDVASDMIKDIVTEQDIQSLRFEQTARLVFILAHFEDIVLLETVLCQLEHDVKNLNEHILNEIYDALLRVANREYIKHDNTFEKPLDFEAADHIADMMIGIFKMDSLRARFLNIKILCSGAKNLPYSSLKYSKELYSITKNENLARNIVGLLVDRNVTDAKEYIPYLSILESSDNPDYCMLAANAEMVLRRYDAADFYAYKALYLLNGNEDPNIFRRYLNYWIYNRNWISSGEQLKVIKGGTVVNLVEDGMEDVTEQLTLCLDHESELGDTGNHSMDIEHILYGTTEYTKLCGSSLNQVVVLRERKYRVNQIMYRTQFGINYVYRKTLEKPDDSNKFITIFTSKDAEDLLSQIRTITDEREKQVRYLIDLYNFKKFDIGLPIECIISGDYDRYIDIFRYLLYAKDEAFYAGNPVFEDEVEQKYVLTLSTLVLVALLDRFDILSGIKEDIIIPESYIPFVKERYDHSYADNSGSKMTVFFAEGNPVLKEIDKSTPQVWELILNFMDDCKVLSVSDDERLSLEIIENVSAEMMMSNFRLGNIQLDSLVLVKRENATYVCDDLFFRKLAASIGVRNINSVSIAEHYSDIDMVTSFIMELSKTNYIYVPILAKDDKQAQELCNNLMNGVKKRKYYMGIFRYKSMIREKLLREIYGDEYIDRLIQK